MPFSSQSVLWFPVLFAAWIALISPLVSKREVNDANRLVGIDGLRGILAMMVFCHHFGLWTRFQGTGQWRQTEFSSWNMLGQSGVTVFFMVTGYLFVDKIRQSGGRLPIGRFIVGRVLRLYPVYLLAVCAALVISNLMRPVDVSPTGQDSLHDVWNWLRFYATRLLGYEGAGLIVAYVVWSLRYEWCFYLSLPVVAKVWRIAGLHPAFILALAALSFLFAPNPVFVVYSDIRVMFISPFAIGGCVSLIPSGGWFADRLRGQAGLWMVIGGVATEFTFIRTAYSVPSYLVLALVFAPITVGQTACGLLKLPALRFLGSISYDIYILHGVVLFLAYGVAFPSALPALGAISAASHLFIMGFFVIAVASIAHFTIERPMQTLSARLVGTGNRDRLAAP